MFPLQLKTLYDILEKTKLQRKKDQWIPRGWEQKLTTKQHKEIWGDDGIILQLDCGGHDYTTVYICQNSKNYTACKLYLNKPDFKGSTFLYSKVIKDKRLLAYF